MAQHQAARQVDGSCPHGRGLTWAQVDAERSPSFNIRPSSGGCFPPGVTGSSWVVPPVSVLAPRVPRPRTSQPRRSGWPATLHSASETHRDRSDLLTAGAVSGRPWGEGRLLPGQAVRPGLGKWRSVAWRWLRSPGRRPWARSRCAAVSVLGTGSLQESDTSPVPLPPRAGGLGSSPQPHRDALAESPLRAGSPGRGLPASASRSLLGHRGAPRPLWVLWSS